MRQELLERLIDCRLVGATSQLNFNREPERLPLRELPHGSWANVYLLYLSYTKTHGNSEEPASRSTFFQVCQRWRKCLRFHKRTQHAVCDTCSRLKMHIRHAGEPYRGLHSNLFIFYHSKLVPVLDLFSSMFVLWVLGVEKISGHAEPCLLV